MTRPATSPTLPSAGTRLVALLGDPITHSLSPRIQNAAFHAAGVDGVYLALRCDSEALPGLLRGIARAGGAGNVTIPHKEAAARIVDIRAEAVERTGACNTFWYEDGHIRGDNTDVIGFKAAVATLLGGSPRDCRVLLLGAGGGARSALCALSDEGADEVVVLNRTRQRAEAVAGVAGPGLGIRVASDLREVSGERFDLVVNATPLGLSSGDPLPLPADAGVEVSAALDMVYRSEGTTWIRHLAGAGIRSMDGSEMLLHQGAAAFRLWWREDAPIEAMREALSRP